MQTKIMLRRADGSTAQLAITADATASVADLAQALSNSDPHQLNQPPAGGGLTLRLEHAAFDRSASGQLLEQARGVLDSGLRSGSTVSIAGAAKTEPRRRRGRCVAVLRVVSGPDVGLEFPLPAGNSTIGAGRSNDVSLTDRSLKDVQAAVRVGSGVEVFNVAGPGGVCVNGQPVQRATAAPNDVIQLGDSTVVIVPTVLPGQSQAQSLAIAFNRSPRVVARFEELEFSAPRPPQPPESTPLPVVSLVAPLILGLILFAVTRSLLGIVFIALSPLLMIGMYLDTRRQAANKYRQERERFTGALTTLSRLITEAQQVERAVRLAEAPALSQVVEAIHRLAPLLWTHRPEFAGFLTVRLGVADAPSRCRIRLLDSENADGTVRDELTDFERGFSTVPEVPIVADFRESGALGVCGPRGVADAVARGFVIQLAGLHSPADLTLTALASAESRAAWEWMEWLPHTGSVHSPLSGNHLTDSANGGQTLLSELEELVRQRLAEQQDGDFPFGEIAEDRTRETRAPTTTPAVVVLIEDSAPLERSRLIRLTEQGGAVGVHVIWVATQVANLPASCRTFLMIESASAGASVGQVRRGTHCFPVACESIDVADARQVALLLAPIVDAGATVTDDSDLPKSVSYLEIAGTRLATDPAAIAQNWTANGSVLDRNGRSRAAVAGKAGLRALVGMAGAQQMYLDLREHGPHALVGGTTGSGKSELLQSWITAMAAEHSPDRVSFLLVDYKGGTAFAECVALPHTVGLVTDLSPHLVRRALTSLGAEIRHREKLLNLKRAKDLVSLEQTGDPDTPPALVIIVDEFAALAAEVPEFVDGVIDVAQRGRSLGLHLILATQRPAGIIKDSLRANTNLRIALRLNDIDDAIDVIDDPAAACFPPELPGRAVAKTGPGRLTTFQSAYVGGWTSDQPEQASVEISEFVFGRKRPWRSPMLARHSTGAVGPNDVSRITANIAAAAGLLGIPCPRKPWLPPLQPVYELEKLVDPADSTGLVIGISDAPTLQTQPRCAFAADDAGNMAIIGTGGSGKSTALRTVAVSAALTEADGPAHVYAIDFSSGSLKVLETLPHVAAVVSGDDDERIGRILRRLIAVLEDRARRFGSVNASTLTDYRALADRGEPRILLLIDGIGPFRDQYEHVSANPYFAWLSQIASDGRMLGVHVIVTADRPGSISASLASTVQNRLVMRLATDDDYLLAGVPAGILSSSSPPGRGVLDRSEVQLGVFGGDPNVSVQARAIDALAARMRETGFPSPEPVQRLPENIELEALPPGTASGTVVVGLADESLQPIGVRPTGVLMVTGPPGSGRSTALVTLAQAVRRSSPLTRIVHLATAASNIAGLGVWDDHASDQNEIIALIDQVIGRKGPLMIVIESVADFANTEAESHLADLVKTVGDKALVVGESEVSGWGQAWVLAQPFKAARRGILLWPSGVEADSLLSTSVGVLRHRDLPPGRGLLIERGKGSWLQMAQPVM